MPGELSSTLGYASMQGIKILKISLPLFYFKKVLEQWERHVNNAAK